MRLKLGLSALGLSIAMITAGMMMESNVEPDAHASTQVSCQGIIALSETFKGWDVPLPGDLQLYICELSERYGIEPELILAVIGIESNYKADAYGEDVGSIGLMQIYPEHHQERMKKFNVTNLYDPYENVLIGVDYLAECIGRGSVERGLDEYNGGKEYADSKQRLGIRTEYVEKVMMLKNLIQENDNVHTG